MYPIYPTDIPHVFSLMHPVCLQCTHAITYEYTIPSVGMYVPLDTKRVKYI